MLPNSADSTETETTNGALADEEKLHARVILLLEIRGSLYSVRSLVEEIGGKILIQVNQPKALLVRMKYGQQRILESLPYVKVHNVALRPRPILRIRFPREKDNVKFRYVVRDNQIIRVKRNQKSSTLNNKHKKS